MKHRARVLFLAGLAFLAASSAICRSAQSLPGPEPWRLPGEAGAPGLRQAVRPLPPPDVPPGGGDRSWPQTTLSTVVPPVFYDLDRDGSLDVIAADDRYVYVYNSTGGLRPGWPRDTGGSMMQAAVGDLDGDGSPDILIGSGYPTARLWAFDKAGNTLPGWPVQLPFTTFTNTTCPVLVDLDGDTHMDVGVASENGVSFFDAHGISLPGWPYLWPVPINNPQWSAPAVGDVDHDGSLEVAVGNADYPNWGVHLIRADGTSMPGWPKVIKPVFSSPALADLDGNGTLEIIAQEGDPGSQGYRMWVWRYDGTVLPGWPHNIAVEGQSSRSSPAVADIDFNGVPEIITATGDGNLHILRPDGTEYPGYPRPSGGVQPISSPSVIDVDHDAIEEIFLTYWLSNAQYVGAWRLDGTPLSGFPRALFTGTDLNSHSSVHLADVEGDGILDLTASGCSSSSGRIWVLPILPSAYDPATTRADWPKMRRDSANLGCFPLTDPAGVADAPASGLTGLRFRPNPLSPGGGLTLRMDLPGKDGVPGRLVVLDAAGRMRGEAPCRSGADLLLPWGWLFGEERTTSGTWFLRWIPDDGATPVNARLVVAGR